MIYYVYPKEGRTMAFSARLTRWGNSIGIRLPKHVVEALNLEPGGSLEVSLGEDNTIIMSPERRYRLEDLVCRISEENRPGETGWGPDVGREQQ
jgi:antitoxin MazE